MVLAFQTILTRNLQPLDTGVISVTMIHTGEATNVIPQSCVLEGTVRTFTTEVLDQIERRMGEIVRHTAAASAQRPTSSSTATIRRPSTQRPRPSSARRRTLKAWAGEDAVHDFEPTMGAEDFSYFLQAKPGCYFLIGNGDGTHREGGHGLGPCMLHNPHTTSTTSCYQWAPACGALW